MIVGIQLSCALILALLGIAQAGDEDVTFNRDVAPIVFQNCATCHRPNEAAPFPLLSYDDVKRRAKQIGIVTQSGYMPPWLPERGHNEFVDERGLDPDELQTLLQWIEAGAPEGDPNDLPPVPVVASGWQLGEPDLVIAMDPYELPAEGRDIYRNFVIPAPVRNKTFVRAVEWKPGNRPVIHHAVLFVDSSGSSRILDQRDPGPGFEGMSIGQARIPDGQFVGWAPGKQPVEGSTDMAWSLNRKTDVVLQLHMRPTGKVERVQVRVGLYFSDEPPRLHPEAIRLLSREIDIPPGEQDYLIEDQYELPVDLLVLGVYPHAHYLGKELLGYATLPDGTRQWLVNIPSWDFNWQDEYRYVEPIALPKGSVISMHYTFDNSADNPLNPNQPPKRVVHGEQSSDEMAELLLTVLTDEADLPILWNDFAWKVHEQDLAYAQRRAQAEPQNARWRNMAATYLLRGGRAEEAIAHYLEVVKLRPGNANALSNLGHAYLSNRDLDQAAQTLQEALDINPRHFRALIDLGLTQQARGNLEAAKVQYQRVLDIDPQNAVAHTYMGIVLDQQGKRRDAINELRLALDSAPDHVEARTQLGMIFMKRGQLDEAIKEYERVLRLTPNDGFVHNLLGRTLAERKDYDEAIAHFETALALEPGRPEYVENLRAARASKEAWEDYEEPPEAGHEGHDH